MEIYILEMHKTNGIGIESVTIEAYTDQSTAIKRGENEKKGYNRYSYNYFVYPVILDENATEEE